MSIDVYIGQQKCPCRYPYVLVSLMTNHEWESFARKSDSYIGIFPRQVSSFLSKMSLFGLEKNPSHQVSLAEEGSSGKAFELGNVYNDQKY